MKPSAAYIQKRNKRSIQHQRRSFLVSSLSCRHLLQQKFEFDKINMRPVWDEIQSDLQNALAMATCSKMAMIGTIASPVPKSESIVSNVTISTTGSVELEELDTGRSKLNGGRWKDGMPDSISPKYQWILRWWMVKRFGMFENLLG